MKASIITLLPAACFMQSALAAPTESVPAASPHIKDRDVESRDLLGGLLGGSGSLLSGLPILGGLLGSTQSIPGVTDLPVLTELNGLVNQVVQAVQGIDSTLTGATGGNVTNILGPLTSQLGGLQGTVNSIASTVTGLVGNGNLSLPEIAGISTLLARVFNAVATLTAQLTTVASRSDPTGVLQPVFGVLNQVLTTVGSILNLGILNI